MADNKVELLLKLKAQSKGLNSTIKELDDLDKSLENVEKEAKKSGKSLESVGKNVKGIAAIGAAAAAAAAGIGTLVSKVNSMNVELRRNSALAGTSVENFQAMQQIAARTGVTAEQTADALNDVNLKINEYNTLGSGAAGDVLRKIGLDPAELAKIDDSVEQTIKVIEALKKTSKGNQRLFADEFASDSFIFLADSVKDVKNVYGEYIKVRKSNNIVSSEESEKLLKINKEMTEITAQIKKLGAQVVSTYSEDIKNALTTTQGVLDKFQNSLNQDFSQTKSVITKASGLWGTLTSSLALVKDQADAMWYSLDNGDSSKFNENVKEYNKSLRDFEENIKKLVYTNASLAQDSLKNLEKEIGEFDVGKAIADGMSTKEIENKLSEFQKSLISKKKEIDKELSGESSIVKNSIDNQFKSIQNSLTKTINSIDKIKKETVVQIKPEISEKNKVETISDLENVIKEARAKIGVFEIQFKSGSINLEEYKKSVSEQLKIEKSALEKAEKGSTGLYSLDYKKQIEQNKIASQDLAQAKAIITKQQEAENKKKEEQIKINDEISKQEIELLDLRGKQILALEKQKELDIEAIKRRKELNDSEKNQLISGVKDKFGLEKEQIKAENLSKIIDKIYEKIEKSSGAERVSLLGNLAEKQKELNSLSKENASVSEIIAENEAKRIEFLESQKLTEDEIRQASNTVLKSKIAVLKQQGEINKASDLELQLAKEQIDLNKTYTDQQKSELKNDLDKLNVMEKQKREAVELEKDINKLFSTLKDSKSVENQKEIVNQIVIMLNSLNDIEKKTAGTQTNYDKYSGQLSDFMKKANESTIDLAYSQDLLKQKEIELLQIQGQKEAALNKQFELTEKNIVSNQKLDEVTKNQVLEIEKQKLAYAQARIEVENIEKQVEKTLEQMRTADTVEEYNKLAASIEQPIYSLQKLEEKFPGLTTKSKQFTDEAIKGVTRFKTSVEEASNFYSETLIDDFDSIISKTGDVKDALKSMIQSIAKELLKSNLSSLFQNIFGKGGFGSGFSDIFTGVAGLFTGKALHTGGIAGQDGFARNFKVDLSGITKYHTGGIAGLKPNEVPTVLEKGEEILTKNDSRHVNNGGKTSNSINIINEINSENAAKELGNTRSFKKAIRNEIMNNNSEYKSMLSQ